LSFACKSSHSAVVSIADRGSVRQGGFAEVTGHIRWGGRPYRSGGGRPGASDVSITLLAPGFAGNPPTAPSIAGTGSADAASPTGCASAVTRGGVFQCSVSNAPQLPHRADHSRAVAPQLSHSQAGSGGA